MYVKCYPDTVQLDRILKKCQLTFPQFSLLRHHFPPINCTLEITDINDYSFQSSTQMAAREYRSLSIHILHKFTEGMISSQKQSNDCLLSWATNMNLRQEDGKDSSNRELKKRDAVRQHWGYVRE